MSTSRRRCLSAWGHSRHAPSFGAPVINRRRRANGHPRVFSGARDVPRHARGRPFPQRCRHRPVVSHDLPGLLGTAPRGVVSPQRHPHQGQATINRTRSPASSWSPPPRARKCRLLRGDVPVFFRSDKTDARTAVRSRDRRRVLGIGTRVGMRETAAANAMRLGAILQGLF